MLGNRFLSPFSCELWMKTMKNSCISCQEAQTGSVGLGGKYVLLLGGGRREVLKLNSIFVILKLHLMAVSRVLGSGSI